MQHRQGDFLFIREDAAPRDATPEHRDNGKVIIGYGEATGHQHTVTAPDARVDTLNGMRWLVAPSGCEVTHQEHKTITLPPGVWVVVQERTYHAGKIKRVVD